MALNGLDEKQAAVARATPFWRMFISPVETLESLRERPAWLCAAVVPVTFAVAVNLYVVRRIGLGRVIQAATQSSAAINPETAVQSALAHPYQILSFQALSTFVGSILTILLIAKVIWLTVTVCGQDVSFKKILAVTAYVTSLPAIIRGCMLALTTTFIRDLSALDLKNPLATNAAFFLRPSSPLAFRILTALDAITLLTVFLLILGLTKVCPRLSLQAASLAVVIPWALYVGATLLLPSILA